MNITNFSSSWAHKAFALLAAFSLLVSLVPMQVGAQAPEGVGGGNPGAIWSTIDGCADSTQDANSYEIGEIVYINGSGFNPGDYDWDITGQPGGASADPNIEVAGGTYEVDGTGEFCIEAYTVASDDDGTYNITFGNKSDSYRVNGITPGPETTLTLEKRVSGEGSANGTEWLLKAEGAQGFEGAGGATRTWTESEFDAITVPTWDLVETPVNPGDPITDDYIAGNWECRVTGDLNGALIPLTNGNQITLEKSDDITCVITNTYRDPGTDSVDLSITKTAEATTYNVGDAVVYTIVVTNNGTLEATDVTMTDTLEAGLTYTTANPTPATTTPLTWNLGTLAVGASTTITVEAAVGSTMYGESLDNTAVVDSTEADANETDNTATETVRINDRPLEPCTVTVVSDTTNTVVEKDGANALALTYVHPAWNLGTLAIPSATWIWGDNPVANPAQTEIQTFEKTFVWNGPVTDIDLLVASDNGHRVFMNGELVGTSPDQTSFDSPAPYDAFASEILTGMNTLAVEVTNTGGNSNPANNPAGLRYSMTITGNTSDDCTVVPPPEPDTYIIEGYVWHDDNRNEVWDGFPEEENEEEQNEEEDVENSLAGWTVNISNGDDMFSTTTDEFGYYYFEVEAGTWIITEEVEEGWERTTQESFEVTVPEPVEEELVFFQAVVNFIIPTAHAAVADRFGFFNFGNDRIASVPPPRSGGGGVLTGRPTPPDLPEPASEVAGEAISTNMPEPQVLGEQVSIVPVGAPATGKGGAAAQLTIIGQLLTVPRRFTRN